jgi:hypothetical protein
MLDALLKVTRVTKRGNKRPSLSGYGLPLCKQSNPLHSGMVGPINHIGHILKIHIGISANERNLLRSR